MTYAHLLRYLCTKTNFSELSNVGFELNLINRVSIYHNCLFLKLGLSKILILRRSLDHRSGLYSIHWIWLTVPLSHFLGF